ncbi:MAG: DDE-type integrase/transposase/recombinase [Lachnospiraceae bacterium]|nr:DDE-type integrase/transposase/recombinase [Lachnospiraceae bacterium]
MPWKETDKMEQKEMFIKAMLENEKPFKHLCDEFGISEKTGHKWKKRFYEQGKLGLYEKSRRPDNSPNQIDGDTAAELICLKNAHNAWGPKKIRELYAKAYPEKDVPSLSSVKRILEKAGLVEKKRIRKPCSPECTRLQQQIKAEVPNDVWCIDFKGWWKSNGEICEPFTVRDRYSRKILCAKLMTSKSSEAVRAVMTELFEKYGLPKVIHSDNGSPFAAPNGLLNLTNLSAWWITLGILPDRSMKGCPGQNGSLERMHADMAKEIEGKVPGGIRANQVVIDCWVKEYNSVRPNEAINMKTPDEIYVKSDRKYLGDYDEIEYPPGFQVRKVNNAGTIIVKGLRPVIGYALRGLQVGLKPIADSNSFDVFLSDFLLGTLDMDSVCFYPLNELKS